MNSYVVVDIETTGLDPNKEDIIEIGAIKVINGEVVDEFNELIQPTKEISEFITNLTGITNEMVANKPSQERILADFSTFIDDVDVLIGHNIDRFDLPFIKCKMDACQLSMKEFQTIDTVLLAKIGLERVHVQSFRLDSLCQHFGIIIEGRHRAFGDVYATYELFTHHLLPFLGQYQTPKPEENCPTCENGKLVLRKGMYGSFKGCSNYPRCRYTKKVR